MAAEAEHVGGNYIIHQPLSVKTEPTMLAALAGIIGTNVAVDKCLYVYRCDPSLGKGAFVYASLHEKIAEAIWV